jgi:hypothetical protein
MSVRDMNIGGVLQQVSEQFFRDGRRCKGCQGFFTIKDFTPVSADSKTGALVVRIKCHHCDVSLGTALIGVRRSQ